LDFLDSRNDEIRRIANHSGGKYEPGDIVGELLITAEKIARTTGNDVDFRDPEQQSQLIAHTYNRLLRFSEPTLRRAWSLDEHYSDDNPATFVDLLTNGSNEDPSNIASEEQDEANKEQTLQRQTLINAWVELLRQRRNRMTNVAFFLRISLSYTYNRFNHAVLLDARQASLPLELPHGAPSDPRRWRPFRLYRAPQQLAFEFDDELPFEEPQHIHSRAR